MYPPVCPAVCAKSRPHANQGGVVKASTRSVRYAMTANIRQPWDNWNHRMTRLSSRWAGPAAAQAPGTVMPPQACNGQRDKPKEGTHGGQRADQNAVHAKSSNKQIIRISPTDAVHFTLSNRRFARRHAPQNAPLHPTKNQTYRARCRHEFSRSCPLDSTSHRRYAALIVADFLPRISLVSATLTIPTTVTVKAIPTTVAVAPLQYRWVILLSFAASNPSR